MGTRSFELEPRVPDQPGAWARVKRPVLGLLFVLVACGSVAMFGIAGRQKRWDGFRRRHEDRCRVHPLGPVSRQTLSGPMIPGDAMDDYCAGMRSLFGDRAVIESMKGDPGEFVDAPGYSLDSFRSGTRRSHCTYIREWPWAPNGGYLVSRLLEFTAQRHRRAGRLAEALAELQVMAQLGLDLGNSPDTLAVGHGMLHTAVHELVELIRDRRTTPELLARIESTVAFMDRYFPTAVDVTGRMGVFVGEQILREGGRLGFVLRPPFLAEDQAYCRFDEQWDAFLALQSDSDSRAWTRFQPEYRERFMKFVEKGGRWFQLPAGGVEDAGARNDGRAHIRLVLAGLLARRGIRPGEPSWPRNPYSRHPVGLDADSGEVSCDDTPWTGGCWARGYTMVLNLER